MDENYKTRDFGNIYRLIYKEKQSSRQQIAKQLEISLPTVAHNLNLLEESGLIFKDGTFQSTGGRKANIFRCVPNSRCALGIDITQERLSIVLIDLNLNIMDKRQIRRPFEDAKPYYENLAREIESLLAGNQIDRKHFLGTGISLPAIIKKDHKTISYLRILYTAGDVYQHINESLSPPVLVFNDANSAGLAESRFSDPSVPALYLFLSNSVGGSLTLDGKIFSGTNSYASEFGHMCIVPNGKQCYCGGYGHLDAYCSAKTLSSLTKDDLDAFFQELSAGNPKCRLAFDEYLDYLALAINNLRMCYDCDIILGGTVGAHMAGHMEDIRRRAVALNPFTQNGNFIKDCHFRTEAAAVGAAIHYIDQFVDAL